MSAKYLRSVTKTSYQSTLRNLQYTSSQYPTTNDYLVFGNPQITDDTDTLIRIARADILSDLPVIDIEVILDILIASLDDVARESMTLRDVVRYVVVETIDFKSSNPEGRQQLIDLLDQYYLKIYQEVSNLGLIENGRFHYAFKGIQLDGTFLLQGADLDT